MVHESGFDDDYSASDVEFIKDFSDRILNGKDPLTLLRQKKEEELARKRAVAKERKNTRTEYVYADSEPNSNNTSKVVLVIVFILVVLFLLGAGVVLWAASVLSTF